MLYFQTRIGVASSTNIGLSVTRLTRDMRLFMDIGEKFKKIRKQRKLTIQQLSEIAGSKASISAFENGKSSLSTDVLLSLASEMCLNYDEILDMQENNIKIIALDHKIQKALATEDEEQFRECIASIWEMYHKSGNYQYWMLATSCEVLGEDVFGWTASENLVESLRDYFFSIEVWTMFDIAQLGLIVNKLNNESIYLLAREIHKQLHSPLRNGYDRVGVDTILEMITILLKRKDKNDSNKLIELLEKSAMPFYFAYQTARLKYLRSIWNCLFTNDDLAISKKDAILSSVEVILSSEIAEKWQSDF